VLGGDAGGWRLGLGVLHNRGVAAWLAAWDGLPAPAPVSAYEAAGVTWWLEGDILSAEATRKRIMDGPPR